MRLKLLLLVVSLIVLLISLKLYRRSFKEVDAKNLYLRMEAERIRQQVNIARTELKFLERENGHSQSDEHADDSGAAPSVTGFSEPELTSAGFGNPAISASNARPARTPHLPWRAGGWQHDPR